MLKSVTNCWALYWTAYNQCWDVKQEPQIFLKIYKENVCVLKFNISLSSLINLRIRTAYQNNSILSQYGSSERCIMTIIYSLWEMMYPWQQRVPPCPLWVLLGVPPLWSCSVGWDSTESVWAERDPVSRWKGEGGAEGRAGTSHCLGHQIRPSAD